MNLAADHLRDYLATNEITQGEFAVAAKASQSFVSQVLDGTIPISAGNLSKLLEGLKTKPDKMRFLVAYLHDQVPSEHVHDLTISVADEDLGTDTVQEIEINSANVLDRAIMQVLEQFPIQTKAQIYRFVQALRVDPELRNVFHGLMRYVPAATPVAAHTGRTVDSAGPFPIGLIKKAHLKKEAAEPTQEKNKSTPVARKSARSARGRTAAAAATKKK